MSRRSDREGIAPERLSRPINAQCMVACCLLWAAKDRRDLAHSLAGLRSGGQPNMPRTAYSEAHSRNMHRAWAYRMGIYAVDVGEFVSCAR